MMNSVLSRIFSDEDDWFHNNSIYDLVSKYCPDLRNCKLELLNFDTEISLNLLSRNDCENDEGDNFSFISVVCKGCDRIIPQPCSRNVQCESMDCRYYFQTHIDKLEMLNYFIPDDVLEKELVNLGLSLLKRIENVRDTEMENVFMNYLRRYYKQDDLKKYVKIGICYFSESDELQYQCSSEKECNDVLFGEVEGNVILEDEDFGVYILRMWDGVYKDLHLFNEEIDDSTGDLFFNISFDVSAESFDYGNSFPIFFARVSHSTLGVGFLPTTKYSFQITHDFQFLEELISALIDFWDVKDFGKTLSRVVDAYFYEIIDSFTFEYEEWRFIYDVIFPNCEKVENPKENCNINPIFSLTWKSLERAFVEIIERTSNLKELETFEYSLNFSWLRLFVDLEFTINVVKLKDGSLNIALTSDGDYIHYLTKSILYK